MILCFKSYIRITIRIENRIIKYKDSNIRCDGETNNRFENLRNIPRNTAPVRSSISGY